MSSEDKKEDICERPDCKWVNISQEPDFYVCLRCSKQKKVEKKEEKEEKKGSESDSSGVIIIALIVALIIALMMSFAEQSNPPTYRYRNSSSPTRY
ncbi:MAG: hypothetical protein F6K35_08375 [Okeania sp. SIO2H7]|nr:hypothetical protein [Okeania sp. SIO2H7]